MINQLQVAETNDAQQVFNFGEQEVRAVVVFDQVWFVAQDVCEALDIKNTTQAVAKLDEDERSMFNIGRQGKVNIVNESGLYSLILTSRKPEAKAFKKWITSEVLPMIRKTGMYVTDNVWDQIHNDPAKFGELLIKYGETKKELEESRRTVHILTHVNKTYTTTEIAKELGFKSAAALNKDLSTRKIQFQQNKTWILYSKYADQGYVDIKQEVIDSGKVIYHRKWTQRGREFLVKLYQ